MSRMQGLALPANATTFMARQREQADKLRAQHGIEPRPWYRITNAASPDEAEVMLYDEVGGWYGATADQFVADLRGVTSPNLRVRINSPGGSVFEGIAIANALRSHPANVTIQVDGIAASIASVIAMAGDRVEMAPQTMLMIHDASGLCMGNASDMEEMAELLDLISDNIADSYTAKAGGTREQWREQMRAETWFLPEDAVKAGLADEAISMPKRGEPVVEPGEDEPEMRQFDLTAYGYNGPTQASSSAGSAPTLTISIGGAVDEALVERLRAAVQAPVLNTTPEPPEPPPVMEPDPDPGPEPPAEPTLPPGVEPGVGNPGDGEGPSTEGPPPVEGRVAEPSDSAVAPAAAADTEWADLVARLTTSPPSADDEFTRLKEALL